MVLGGQHPGALVAQVSVELGRWAEAVASLAHDRDLVGTGVSASSMGACSETQPGEFSSGWDQRQP